MDGAVNGSGAGVTIDRLACRFHLPIGLDDPGAARTTLARLAEREVPRACEAALASLPDDEAVYRIRHLHLEVWLDLQGMSEQEMARRWGRLLAVAVMRAVHRGRAQDMVRFDSPRRFVAAFLRDLLDGRAWGRWYYAEFHPLQRLPLGAIALELVTPRPGWIAPLLVELAETGHAERLIEHWEVADIARLWSALGFAAQPSGLGGRPEVAEAVSRLASVWPGVALSSAAEPAARARDRLRLWLTLAASYPEAARDPSYASAVHALVDLTSLLAADPELAPVFMMETELYPALAQRIRAGAVGDALGWLGPLASTSQGRAVLGRLAEAAAAPLRWSSAAAMDEARPVGPRPTLGPGRRAAAGGLSSPVGSVFLVAPALAEVGLWERWLDQCGEQMARRYVFLLAIKTLGRERAPLVLGDPMLAAFAGLHEPPVADARLSSTTLSANLAKREREHVVLSASLPDIAARWYPARQRQLVVGAAQGVEVLRDAAAACWLAACPTDPSSTAAAPLACLPELAAEVAAARRELSAEEQELLASEARHLQLGHRLGYPWLTPQIDAALSTAASLVLRRTAARLPGFPRASPAYLARQFLAQPASLRASPEALQVRLSGGPLAMVLRLAGLPDALEVPWLSQPLRLMLPGLLGQTR